MTDKQEFLCCYDYGKGGLWCFVLSDSAASITLKYPELLIADDPPDWMTEERIKELRRKRLHDIDDDSGEIFQVIIADRGK